MATRSTLTKTVSSALGGLTSTNGISLPGSAPPQFPPVQSVVRNQTRVFLHYRGLYHVSGEDSGSPSGAEGAAVFGGGSDDGVEMHPLKDHQDGDSVSVDIPPVWVGLESDMKAQFDAVRAKMSALEKLHAAQVLVDVDLESSGTSAGEAKIEAATAEISRMLGELQGRISRMGGKGTGETKAILSNMQKAYAMELRELTTKFRTAQRDYLASIRRRDEKFRDSFSTAESTEMGDDAMLDYTDKGFTDDQMAHMQATERDISTRDKQIRQIYRSIVELNEMTKDLAMIIVDQGTILDRIDYNLECAEETTEEAVKQLESAQKIQKKSRRKLVIIFLLVAVLIAGGILALRLFKLF